MAVACLVPDVLQAAQRGKSLTQRRGRESVRAALRCQRVCADADAQNCVRLCAAAAAQAPPRFTHRHCGGQRQAEARAQAEQQRRALWRRLAHSQHQRPLRRTARRVHSDRALAVRPSAHAARSSAQHRGSTPSACARRGHSRCSAQGLQAASRKQKRAREGAPAVWRGARAAGGGGAALPRPPRYATHTRVVCACRAAPEPPPPPPAPPARARAAFPPATRHGLRRRARAAPRNGRPAQGCHSRRHPHHPRLPQARRACTQRHTHPTPVTLYTHTRPRLRLC